MINVLEFRLALAGVAGQLPRRTTISELVDVMRPVDCGRCAKCRLLIVLYPGDSWLHLDGSSRQCSTAARAAGTDATGLDRRATAIPERGPDAGKWHDEAARAMDVLIAGARDGSRLPVTAPARRNRWRLSRKGTPS